VLKAPSRADLEKVVHTKIRSVLAERGRAIELIRGGDGLNAVLGLTSLDLATLIAELESALGVDPFARIVSITSVRSVDDLVEAYHKAQDPESEGPVEDQGLPEASRRGILRRARRGG
jgi:acyl carrier protein